jgi:flagellin-like protein
MNLKQLFTDDDAVSPVIGVILMVAITVILAAVIGAFVLGFGGGGPSAPSVSWETSTDDSTPNWGSSDGAVIFEHGGGDTIDDPSTLEISGDNVASGDFGYIDGGSLETDLSNVDSLSTGDRLGHRDIGTKEGTMNLIWNSPDSDSTQELASVDYDFN